MRASRFGVFCATVALAHCGYLAACTSLTKEPTAEATPVYGTPGNGVTGTTVAASDAVRPVASVQTFRAGEDAIAALIPAE